MTLRYCLRCKGIIESRHAVHHEDRSFCPKCSRPLLYLGHESSSLSSQDLLKQYDILHPYNPIQDYKGVYKTYISYGAVGDSALLECEDILKHDPYDKDALFFMAKHHWKEGRFDRARDCCKQLKDTHELDMESEQFYVDLLLLDQLYHEIVSYFLNDCDPNRSDFKKSHYLAVSYLGLKQFKDALPHFYEAYALCDHDERKKKIAAIISEISDFLKL